MTPFRAPVRVCPCACGWPLIQYAGESAVDVVVRHNLHPKHVTWRERST